MSWRNGVSVRTAKRLAMDLDPETRAAPQLRLAGEADIGALEALIVDSVRVLQRGDYTTAQIERGLARAYGVDRTLIADGTYFAIEEAGDIAACGGWSKRAKLHGGDRYGRDDRLLDPSVDAAKIRAFYVRPAAARRGLASLLLAASERAARAAGFRRAELGATLTGAKFYAARGYRQTGIEHLDLGAGESLAVVLMERGLDEK
jgi:GNAT superfamily N-acetyltransferase